MTGRKYRPSNAVFRQSPLQLARSATIYAPITRQEFVAIKVGTTIDEGSDAVKDQLPAETILIQHRLRAQRKRHGLECRLKVAPVRSGPSGSQHGLSTPPERKAKPQPTNLPKLAGALPLGLATGSRRLVPPGSAHPRYPKAVDCGHVSEPGERGPETRSTGSQAVGRAQTSQAPGCPG